MQLSDNILPILNVSIEGASFLLLQETNKALNDFPFAVLFKMLCLCGLFTGNGTYWRSKPGSVQNEL